MNAVVSQAPCAHVVAGPAPMATKRVGLPHEIWLLLGGNLLVRAAGFAYPFMTYHVAAQGHGAGTVGAVLAVFGIGSVAGHLLCGSLVDRLGRRSTIVMTMLLAAVVLALMSGARSVPALLGGAAMIGLVFDTPRSVLGAAISELIPDPARRAKVDAWRCGWVANVGAAVAAAVGGLCADRIGIPVLYWFNGIACAVFAAAALYWMPPSAGRPASAMKTTYRQAFSDRRLMVLFASSVAVLTAFMGLVVTIPMLMSARGLSAGAWGAVQLVNALTVIALTPLITRWLSRRIAVRLRLDIVALAAICTAGCLCASAFANTTAEFSVIAAAAAPGQIAWFVAAADVVHRIAPPALRGRYHGIWGMAWAAASVIAPILVSSALARGGQPLVAAAILAAGLIGAALCMPLARVLRGHQPHRHREDYPGLRSAKVA
jgi:MFS family permease